MTAKPLSRTSRPDRLADDLSALLDAQTGPSYAADANLLDRVRRQVMQEIAAAGSQAQLHETVRASERPWEQISVGIERRLLFETAEATSCLLRLSPGTALPGHDHPIDEECLVLEGTLRIGTDLLLHPGDFHVGLQGVPHAQASTDTGAILFVRQARQPADSASSRA